VADVEDDEDDEIQAWLTLAAACNARLDKETKSICKLIDFDGSYNDWFVERIKRCSTNYLIVIFRLVIFTL